MSLSPEERAEKIAKTVESLHSEIKFTKDGIDYIAAQIREAENEALILRIGAIQAELNKNLAENYKRFRRESLEEAAKIADDLCWKAYGDDNCLDIGERIRALIDGKEKK